MKWWIAVIVCIMVLASPAQAQDCGNGLPCGALPWRLPALPNLQSPTPYVANYSLDVVPTNTPAPTTDTSAADYFDGEAVNNQIATLNSVINATPMRVSDFYGSYAETDLSTFGTEAGTFISYLRAFFAANVGIWQPLLAFGLIRFFTTVVIKLQFLLIPVLMALVGFIRKIINLVLDFLPL